jgi:hypothetical protein
VSLVEEIAMTSSVDRHLLERWSDSLAYSMTSRVAVDMCLMSLVSLSVSRSLAKSHNTPLHSVLCQYTFKAS